MMLTSKNQINVMIVNDSPFMIQLLQDLITVDARINVTSTARDGVEALRKIKYFPADVILLDLEMPNMDGLTFIKKVMTQKQIPIIVVSNYSNLGGKLVLDSLELGAVDFVTVPNDSPEVLRRLSDVLISKIDIASKSNPSVIVPKVISKLQPYHAKTFDDKIRATRIVVIGASTGGPKVITDILRDIPSDIPAAFLIVQHMSKEFISNFAQRLNDISNIKVKQASEGEVIKEGVALLAPGDFHMFVKSPNRIQLNQGPKRFGVRPSINVTMVSASEIYGADTIGVLLSGMGQDGAFGMRMIKKRQGITLAQNESSSVIFGMAKAAKDMDVVDKMVSADEIAREIVKAVMVRV
jgi:two-component system chemotaxis response regulator CheB